MIGIEPPKLPATPFNKPHIVMVIISETFNGNSLVIGLFERVRVSPEGRELAHPSEYCDFVELSPFSTAEL